MVAPTQCSSPLAKAGFKRFDASIAPSVLPAPAIICISSMNKTTCPSCVLISFKTAFRRSSNSPRYLAPATSAPKSRDKSFFPFKLSGTSSLIIRCASPSIIAVLPTPGSPMSTGLFFVRRDRICTVRLISSSRPITGSTFPDAAIAVKSCVYFSKAWN